MGDIAASEELSQVVFVVLPASSLPHAPPCRRVVLGSYGNPTAQVDDRVCGGSIHENGCYVKSGRFGYLT
jgi:hypothetical protein